MTFATLSTSVDRYVPALGTANDGFGRVQAALDDAQSSLAGGRVILGPGIHDFRNPRYAALQYSAFNSGDRGRVTIEGDGAIVRLSTLTPRLIDFVKAADGDTFNWLHVKGLQVDANLVAGRHHVLAGTFRSGGLQTRINLLHMLFEDIRVYNILQDQDTATNHRLAIWLAVSRTAAGTSEGAANLIEDIQCKHVRMEGGNAGIGVLGSGPDLDLMEVYINDVLLEDCYWNAGVAPSAFYASSGFHVGSRGYGDTATLRRCISKNSGDVGIETNALNHVLVEDCSMEDSWSVGYYHSNYHTPEYPRTQRVTYRDCHTKVSGALPTAPAYGINFAGHAVGGGGVIPLGHVRADGGSYRRDYAGATVPGSNSAIICTAPTEVKSFRARGFDIEFLGFVTTGAPILNCITLTPAVTRATMSLHDIGIIVSGTRSTGTLTVCGCITAGIMHFVADEFDTDFNVTTSSVNGLRIMDLGSAAGSQMRGGVSRVRCRAMVGDATPRGIIVRNSELLTLDAPFVIDKCDLKAVTDAGGNAILYPATSNAANVTERDNRT